MRHFVPSVGTEHQPRDRGTHGLIPSDGDGEKNGVKGKLKKKEEDDDAALVAVSNDRKKGGSSPTRPLCTHLTSPITLDGFIMDVSTLA